MTDVRAHNRRAWDRQVEEQNRWTLPAASSIIAEARQGRWNIVLTPTKTVPRAWFPDLRGTEVLCLASGGGQQGPILAAAGAKVTVLDNSPRQLLQDRLVAEREGLQISTVEGDMADLSAFPDGRFALIVHPISNVFVPDVRPVWREAFRVLCRGGVLLAGFTNPAVYLFDEALEQQGELKVRHILPYSDLTSLTGAEREVKLASGKPLAFSHTLDTQIGSQLEAGFQITAFFEDRLDASIPDPLSRYMATSMATRAIKP